MHTLRHTYPRTHICTCTQRQTDRHTHVKTRALARIHTHIYTHTHTHYHTQIILTHTQPLPHAHYLLHTRARAHCVDGLFLFIVRCVPWDTTRPFHYFRLSCKLSPRCCCWHNPATLFKRGYTVKTRPKKEKSERKGVEVPYLVYGQI